MIPQVTRRQLLATAAMSAAATVLPPPLVSLAGQIQAPRALSLYHSHTGEKLDIIYGDANGYDREALIRIDQFLKDHRTDDVHPIDTQLIDLLSSINHHFGGKRTFEVNSGYRSPKTNQKLRRQDRKVAKRSMHMEGKAIDIRIPGVPLHDLQRYARKMRQGGVGYYPKSNFVHLDTGEIRSWRG